MDEFKNIAIIKMLANDRTKNSFTRYCLDDKELDPELKKSLDEYKEKKKQKDKKRMKTGLLGQKSLRKMSRVHALGAEKSDLGDFDALNQVNRDRVLLDRIKRLEKVKKHPDYKGSSTLELGINKKNNISLRHKEGKKLKNQKN